MDQDYPTFPEEMIFNANLQEFANRIGIVCGLEAGEKISQEEAYHHIRELWKQLKNSKKNLRIGDTSDSGK